MTTVVRPWPVRRQARARTVSRVGRIASCSSCRPQLWRKHHSRTAEVLGGWDVSWARDKRRMGCQYHSNKCAAERGGDSLCAGGTASGWRVCVTRSLRLECAAVFTRVPSRRRGARVGVPGFAVGQEVHATRGLGARPLAGILETRLASCVRALVGVARWKDVRR